MNQDNTSLNLITESISKSLQPVIVLPSNPSQDAIAAACSLYLGLTKIYKSATMASESAIESTILASEKIKTSLKAGGEQLVISFPNAQDVVEKVDYKREANAFNLIITPVEGTPSPDPASIKFSFAGGDPDLIIAVDGPNLQSFGQLYSENKELFESLPVINIDRHLINQGYGSHNFVFKQASSTSELAYVILQSLDNVIDSDISSVILQGITFSTNNFTSSSVNAETFEAAASLLRAGAKRTSVKSMQQSPKNQEINQSPQPANTQAPRPMRNQNTQEMNAPQIRQQNYNGAPNRNEYVNRQPRPFNPQSNRPAPNMNRNPEPMPQTNSQSQYPVEKPNQQPQPRTQKPFMNQIQQPRPVIQRDPVQAPQAQNKNTPLEYLKPHFSNDNAMS